MGTKRKGNSRKGGGGQRRDLWGRLKEKVVGEWLVQGKK